jgi:hypothetical protein
VVIEVFLAGALLQAAQPVRIDCTFTGEDPSSDETGPRPIALAIATQGARVTSVSVDDPTGIFTSGNIVGSFSTSGGFRPVPRNEEPRWRGTFSGGRLSLSGSRREVSLTTAADGSWTGRLRYILPGAGSMRIVKDGTLSCRQTAPAAQGNSQ